MEQRSSVVRLVFTGIFHIQEAKDETYRRCNEPWRGCGNEMPNVEQISVSSRALPKMKPMITEVPITRETCFSDSTSDRVLSTKKKSSPRVSDQKHTVRNYVRWIHTAESRPSPLVKSRAHVHVCLNVDIAAFNLMGEY